MLLSLGHDGKKNACCLELQHSQHVTYKDILNKARFRASKVWMDHRIIPSSFYTRYSYVCCVTHFNSHIYFCHTGINSTNNEIDDLVATLRVDKLIKIDSSKKHKYTPYNVGTFGVKKGIPFETILLKD